MKNNNHDLAELSKFADLAHHWWDPQGEFKTLHDINPLRVDWVRSHSPLSGRRVADIGCGGGIFAEAMAGLGATVTGIDLADRSLAVARMHLLESGQQVDYRLLSAEALAEESPGQFDVVTCLEMLEHVPDPGRIVAACARLVKPEGRVFFSTLNRNPKSYLMAVVGAEYLLGMLPRGTHDYARFIKPSELLSLSRAEGLDLVEITGLHYDPWRRTYRLEAGVNVNYLLCCRPR